MNASIRPRGRRPAYCNVAEHEHDRSYADITSANASNIFVEKTNHSGLCNVHSCEVMIAGPALATTVNERNCMVELPTPTSSLLSPQYQNSRFFFFSLFFFFFFIIMNYFVLEVIDLFDCLFE